MNWLDIVIIILMIYAVWEGWRQGLVRQALGLAALVLGVFLAYRFGHSIGAFLGLKELAATILGFVIVFVVVVVGVVIIARLTRGLFKIVGLGALNSVLGVLFSMFKMCLIAGVVLLVFETADPEGKILSRSTVRDSVMCRGVTKVTSLVFPFFESLAHKFAE